MNLSDGERLIVVMLAEVMKELKLNHEIDPELILKLAYGGDDWAIGRKYSGLVNSQEPTDALVKETGDILWMWGIIEHSLTRLEDDEATQAGEWRNTQFGGFDGNNDRHYGVAHTMINELGEFGDFLGRGLNSHSQTSLPRYRTMYQKFDKYVQSNDAMPLSFEALREICN